MKTMSPENEEFLKEHTTEGMHLHAVFEHSFFTMLYVNQESLELLP